MILLLLALACHGDTPPDRDWEKPPLDDTAADTAAPDDSGHGDDTGDDTGPSDDTGDDTGPSDDTGDDPITGEAGTFDLSMTVDGVNRSYRLVVPDSALSAMDSGPVPVLFGLHGAGDTGRNFISATLLTNLAADNAFVLVGPDAVQKAWFLSESEGWTGADGTSNSYPNDMALLLTIIDKLDEAYSIDSDRIFVVGHSRGAGFTGLLATLSGQTSTYLGTYTSPFAAYAINAGYDPFGGSLDLSLAQPKQPVWCIHGTADTTVPYSYGQDFATSLDAAGWDVTWTAVPDATHSWLFRSTYGQDDQDLWDWFMAAAG